MLSYIFFLCFVVCFILSFWVWSKKFNDNISHTTVPPLSSPPPSRTEENNLLSVKKKWNVDMDSMFDPPSKSALGLIS